jgi:hypothetical protein
MRPKTAARRLNRYTTLPALLDLLRRKKLVLLDPSTWEDRNDAEIILEYKRRKGIKNLFAVCFGIGDETIHHWKTYANGISGCCVEFDRLKLLSPFQGLREARWGEVRYRKIKQVEENEIELDSMPFTKRWPYRCECEFRILWEGETNDKTIDVDVDLTSINKITLSQHMPPDVCTSIKDLLRDEFSDPSKKIIHSTLYENKRWIMLFRNRARQR